MAKILLEVCVDTIAGLWTAVEGGADRIELCAALSLGGLTPTPGLMAMAAGVAVPVHVLIRPRAGGFCYEPREVAVMLADILAARAAGLDGVVIGASDAAGRLEAGALREMIAAAGPMALTLHRAFDLVPDWRKAVDMAVDLGIGRILTAGGAVTAAEGAGRLAAIAAHAAGRIGILPGAGITAENVAALLAQVPVTEVHASCAVPAPMREDEALRGFGGPGLRMTDRAKVRALKAVLQGL